MTDRELLQCAIESREMAYAPYSGFRVGAALVGKSGKIYKGCNVENAAYSPSNCAERTALFKAVSEGERQFKAIAIAGGKEGQDPVNYVYPCGICRQVMQEFAGSDFCIFVVKGINDYKEYTLAELLPAGFGGESTR